MDKLTSRKLKVSVAQEKYHEKPPNEILDFYIFAGYIFLVFD